MLGYKTIMPLLVCDRDTVRVLGDAGQDLAILFDLDDLGAVGTDMRTRGGGGIGISKGYSAKVAESNKRTTLLVVLNDPLRILFAKCIRR